jgi:hypothetical protein
MKTLSKFAAFLILLTAAAIPARAEENHGLLQERIKVALNEMVQDVRTAESPEAKRQILERFVGKLEHRAQMAERLPFLTKENHAALDMLQAKFGAYSAELKGTAGNGPVADGDLNAFAGFMQQDLEQAADAWWSGDGIYLSAGAIIIILIIIILVT